MRDLMHQTLEVVETTEPKLRQGTAPIEAARQAAVTEVSFKAGVEYSTVSDKYRRQFGFDGTEEFDE